MSRYIDVDKIELPIFESKADETWVKVAINATPKADVRENVHGEWKEVYAETNYRNGWIEFSCPVCECQHGLESGEYGWSYGEDIPWRFCPMCGADMRGTKTASDTKGGWDGEYYLEDC